MDTPRRKTESDCDGQCCGTKPERSLRGGPNSEGIVDGQRGIKPVVLVAIE